jgi:hypothetical protein
VLSGMMELLRSRQLSSSHFLMLTGKFQVLLNIPFEKLFWEFPIKQENFTGKTTIFLK